MFGDDRYAFKGQIVWIELMCVSDDDLQPVTRNKRVHSTHRAPETVEWEPSFGKRDDDSGAWFITLRYYLTSLTLY